MGTQGSKRRRGRRWGRGAGAGGGEAAAVALAAVASATAVIESWTQGVLAHGMGRRNRESWSRESWSDGGHCGSKSESLCHGLGSSSSGLSHRNRHMVCHISITHAL